MSARSLDLHLANLNDRDARFISAVIALFADPQQHGLAADVRSGTLGLNYQPGTGQLELKDNPPPGKTGRN